MWKRSKTEESQRAQAQKKESDEELSGAQFLCEKILRYLTLEEALDHRRPRRMQC